MFKETRFTESDSNLVTPIHVLVTPGCIYKLCQKRCKWNIFIWGSGDVLLVNKI